MNIKKNFTYNIMYQILTMIIPIFTAPYVSRTLGAEGLGRFSYAYSITYYFILFAMLGVNNYGSRTIAAIRDDRRKLSQTFWEIYAFQLIVSVVMTIVYAGYIIFICDDMKIGWIMILYLIGTAFDINWLYFGLEEFKITVTRNTIVKIVTVILIFIFVKSPQDVYIYSLFYSAGMCISQIFLWKKFNKYIDFVKVNWRGIKKHIKQNVILFVPVIAISLYKTMDKIMLGYISSKAEVGYYEACEKILSIPNGFITALGTVIMPRIANLSSNNANNKAAGYLSKSVLFSIACTSSMSLGIMGIANEFVPIFYGDGFTECINIFQLIMPSCIFVGIANVVRTQYLIPYKKDNIYIVSVFLGAAINVIANILLIPKYNAIGAALGTLFAECIVCVYQCFVVRKDIPVIKNIRNGIPLLFIALSMYFILIKMNGLFDSNIKTLVIKVIFGMVFYGIFSGIYIYKFKRIKK